MRFEFPGLCHLLSVEVSACSHIFGSISKAKDRVGYVPGIDRNNLLAERPVRRLSMGAGLVILSLSEATVVEG
jgi:hypothetical protein